MTDTQSTATIADELKALTAIAAALSTLAEAQARDHIFYVALDLANRLDNLSDRYDRQLETAKANSDRGV